MKFTTILTIAALFSTAEGLNSKSKLHAQSESERFKFNRERALHRAQQAAKWANRKASDFKHTARATKAAYNSRDVEGVFNSLND